MPPSPSRINRCAIRCIAGRCGEGPRTRRPRASRARSARCNSVATLPSSRARHGLATVAQARSCLVAGRRHEHPRAAARRGRALEQLGDACRAADESGAWRISASTRARPRWQAPNPTVSFLRRPIRTAHPEAIAEPLAAPPWAEPESRNASMDSAELGSPIRTTSRRRNSSRRERRDAAAAPQRLEAANAVGSAAARRSANSMPSHVKTEPAVTREGGLGGFEERRWSVLSTARIDPTVTW